MRHSSTTPIGVLLAFLVTGAAPAGAQSAAPGAPFEATWTAIAERVAVDSLLALVPPRMTGQIDADIERWNGVQRELQRRRDLTEQFRRETSQARGLQVKEIERVTEGIRIAKELDQDGRRKALERELRLRERYRDLLGARADALEHDRGVIDALARRARAARQRLDLEHELARDRVEWRGLNENPVFEDASERRSDLERAVQERLRRYFEATRDEEREAEKLAGARRTLAEKQLQVLEKRRKLFDD